jgi:L-ascorbate metabolism protein UlaG (beta-lactamase superfamily)
MQVTYLGHSCFEISDGNTSVIIDPFIRPNELSAKIDFEKLNPDYILISHGHEDHIADCIDLAKQSNAKVVANYEIITWLGEKGIENVHPMNTGGKIQCGTFNFQFVVAVHSSGLPDGTYGGNPCGFIIENAGKKYYYSGDTALMPEMKMFSELHALEASFLCIGDNFTMGFEEAAIAAEWLKTNKVIGMHYDTFGYIKIDHQRAVEHFDNKGKQLLLMEIGETLNV